MKQFICRDTQMAPVSDEDIMHHCIELAGKGQGQVAPNPLVGSAVFCRGKIIGEGYHQKFGGPHAEVFAINSVTDKMLLKESRLYVTLEPCCHYGKTPPCTDLIIQSGIPEVVVGCKDPFAEVSGRGIQKLIDAGIKVTTNVLERECRELNRRFITFHTQKRPYIILKWAETSDGFIAREDNTSKWISSEESRVMVHKWRAEESAIMIGTNTAFFDNPQLTVRHVEGINPVRIVTDRTLRLPEDLRLFDGSVPTLVFNEEKNDKKPNLEFIKISFDDRELEHILAALYERDLQSVIVEGGARLLNSFIHTNIWDEARVFVSNIEFGMGLRSPLIARKDFVKSKVGPDALKIYRNYKS